MKKTKDKPPAVFTPDNEPYLGRESVFQYDQVIMSCMEINSEISIYTHQNLDSLSDLQKAATQIIPQGVNLALSIRELVRKGYLFAALYLIVLMGMMAACFPALKLH